MGSHEQTPLIRTYRPADFNRYLGLRQAAEGADRGGRRITGARLKEELASPGLSPHQNLIVAEKGGELRGAVLLVPEPRIGRVILRPLVHPAHRGRGLGRLLLRRGLSSALDLGGRWAHLEVGRGNAAGRRLAERNGFEPVRRFWEMGLDLGGFDPGRLGGSGAAAGCFLEGQVETLTRLQNDSFRGTWGYNPNTTREVAHSLSMGGGSLKDVLVAFEGDRPAGYCWLKIDQPPAAGTGPGEGRVHMLGVRPDSRQRGVALSVLGWGLARLKEMGLNRAVLTVDRGNLQALALYRKAGFQVESETIWYGRELNPPFHHPGE